MAETTHGNSLGTAPRLYAPVLERLSSAVRPPLSATDLEWRNGLLVRAPNWLGDGIMAVPAVHRMRAVVPESCGLFVLCPAVLLPIWEAVPGVAGVIPLNGARARGGAGRTIRGLELGVAVVFPNSFGSALDVCGKSIPVRIGRRGHGRRALLTHCLPPWPRHSEAGHYHQLSRHLELAAVLGVADLSGTMPVLQIADAAPVAAALGLEPAAEWLVLAPGAAYGPAKQWAASSFRAVASWWLKRGGRGVVVGRPGDRPVAAEVTAGMPGLVNLAGRTDLRQLMAVLKCGRAVVANDSGAMHLAAAAGVPGVAVFGSTDATATGPLGTAWVVLTAALPCAPCFDRTCSRRDAAYACLAAIGPEAVCGALQFVLEQDAESDPAPSWRQSAAGHLTDLAAG